MDSLDVFTESLAMMKHFPILQKVALNLPTFLSEKVLPGYSSFRSVRPNCVNTAVVFVLIFCNQGLCKVDLEHCRAERKRTPSKRGRLFYHL